MGLVFFILAAFRDGADRDYLSYESAFIDPNQNSILFIEPSFLIISGLVKFCFQSNVIFLFGIYAFLGVSLKFFGIKQLSNLYFFSILIYLSNYFILHEMTQIRSGVATGILLISIKPMFNRNLLGFLLLVILAFFFHYSSILFLPFYLLSSEKINSFIYSFSLILTYLLHFLNIHFSSLLSLFHSEALSYKLDIYKHNLLSEVHVLNPIQVFRVCLGLFLLWKKDLIIEHNKYFFLLLKIYFFGLCSLVAFADLSAFADRTSELFMVVEVILFPMIIYTIKESVFAFFLSISISLVWMCINLFYLQMLVF